MGGRGSSSKLAQFGGGGVPGINGGGSGGTAVGGGSGTAGGGANGKSKQYGGSAGGSPYYQEPNGSQELNGMAGGRSAGQRATRDHIDGNLLEDEEKLNITMLDTGWSEQKAQTFNDLIYYYSDGNSSEFCGSSDKASFVYGNRPDDSQLMSEGILLMPSYENGDLYRAINIGAGAAEDWFEEMRTGNVFGFAGYYTGKDMAESFSYWSPGGPGIPSDPRDAGVVASFSSSWKIALEEYANLKLSDSGAIIGQYRDNKPITSDNTTIIFRLTGNKTASSITHLAISGADEYEVLSPIWQQFEYGGRSLIKTLPNGHKVYEVTIRDRGIKPKDKGPVR